MPRKPQTGSLTAVYLLHVVIAHAEDLSELKEDNRNGKKADDRVNK